MKVGKGVFSSLWACVPKIKTEEPYRVTSPFAVKTMTKSSKQFQTSLLKDSSSIKDVKVLEGVEATQYDNIYVKLRK